MFIIEANLLCVRIAAQERAKCCEISFRRCSVYIGEIHAENVSQTIQLKISQCSHRGNMYCFRKQSRLTKRQLLVHILDLQIIPHAKLKLIRG